MPLIQVFGWGYASSGAYRRSSACLRCTSLLGICWRCTTSEVGGVALRDAMGMWTVMSRYGTASENGRLLVSTESLRRMTGMQTASTESINDFLVGVSPVVSSRM